MWKNLQYGLRLLHRDRTVTIVSVIALAVSIGAMTTIFSAVDTVLLRALPYPKPHAIVILQQRFEGGGSVHPTSISAPEFADYRAQNRTFAQVAAYAPADVSLTGTSEPERVHAAVVTPDFFRIFAVRPLYGRIFLDEEGQPGRNNSVVLSHSLWQRRFGGERSVIGRTIVLNGRARTVVGVMPASMTFPSDTELWLPLALTPEMLAPAARPGRNLNVAARLKSGVTIEMARQDVAAVVSHFPDSALRANVVGLREWTIGDVRPALLILLAVSALVLLIGCGNVANLLLARAAGRMQEVAIRSALGANRQTLIGQFLAEGVLLALAGGLTGVLLAAWGIPILRAAGPAGIPQLRDAAIDLRVLAFALAISTITGLVFGIAPAFGAPSGRHSLGTRSRRISAARFLIVSELAIAFILLAGAGLLMESYSRVIAVAPGFRPENLLTFELSLPSARYPNATARAQFFRHLIDRLKSAPQVRTAAAISDLPFSGQNADRSFIHDGMSPATFRGSPPSADHRHSTADYFRAMSIPLRAGRFFDERDDTRGAMVAIVNDTLARRMWPGENAIGRRINFFIPGGMEGWRTVVGVVGDVRHRGFESEARPEIHVPAAQLPVSLMAVVLRTAGDPMALSGPARKLVAGLDRDLPLFHVRPMDRLLAGSVETRRFHMILTGIFAAVALILAVTGLYGVMVHWVGRRTQELGIRMALGAQTRDVLRLVVAEGLALAVCGVIVGAAGAFALTRVLARFLYGVAPGHPATLAVNAVLLLAVALAACYVPARRASRIDPLTAIRHE